MEQGKDSSQDLSQTVAQTSKAPQVLTCSLNKRNTNVFPTCWNLPRVTSYLQ